MSTGMAHMDEVKNAVEVLIDSGTSKSRITVLHCTSAYPAPVEDANLNAIKTMRERLNIKIGYSDHTPGIEVASAATALGAVVIEKHLTLDRGLEGPDHLASLEPKEFSSMVKAIRTIELALGDGIKQPRTCELDKKDVARKSIVAARSIKKGEVFTDQNLTTMRPGTGLSPMNWNKIVGTVSKKKLSQG